MPAVLALPAFWGAAGATAAAGAGIYGAHKASESADQANATTAAANAAAIEEQKRQDAQQKAEFDAQQAQAQAQWNAEQQIRAPYRAAGLQSLMKLGDLIGTNYSPSIIPGAPVTAQPNAAPSVKMNALLPGGQMSPGARQVVDPVTGQARIAVNY